MIELAVFVVAGGAALVGALGVVLTRNAVHAAIMLVLTLFGVAVLFVAQDAHFLAAVQVIVYAGAIVVLFLFVIMLLGVDRHESLVERIRGQRAIGITLGVGIVLELIFAIRAGIGFATKAPANFDETVNRGGNAAALSRVLFREYFFPFEVTSILLIIAAVAVMVLAARPRTAATSTDGSDARSSAEPPSTRTTPTEPRVEPVT